MPKIFNNKNVFVAAMGRFDIVYDEFDNYYVSVSGGKDSSIMLQLAAAKAREHKKKLSVLYIDLEAQYKETIKHVEELIEDISDVLEKWYWIALPLSLRNAVSVIQPKWICWDKNDRSKWVRSMPKNKHVINEDNYPCEWSWFKHGMEFEEFILYFAKWFHEIHGGNTAACIGIRSNESLNRFRTIISKEKERYKEYGWTTRVQLNASALDVYNIFPIYDWTTEDDWIAVSKLDLKFNYIYELMYKNGLSINEQRLCQPYGDDQRNGLDQFRYLEPETWEKVLTRVHGVNFGNIYCRSSLLGNIQSEKPDHMTWEQYAVFLLESLGLYAPELRDHYYKKIRTFLDWWEKKAGITANELPDDKWDIKGFRQAPYWKRIARAIERNDFWMKRLSFGQTKSDVQRLHELKKKYANIIKGIETTDGDLKRVANDIEKGNMEGEKMKIVEYVGNYDRGVFYSIVGKYFAEPMYKKDLPYLTNTDTKEWFLFYDIENLVGFCSADIKKDKIVFGEVYSVNKGEGICSKMLNFLSERFQGNGCEILSNKEQIIKNVNKLGFIEVGRRGSYIIMRRDKDYEISDKTC